MVQLAEVYYRRLILRNRLHPSDSPIEIILPLFLQSWPPLGEGFEVDEDLYVARDGQSGPWAEIAEEWEAALASEARPYLLPQYDMASAPVLDERRQ